MSETRPLLTNLDRPSRACSRRLCAALAAAVATAASALALTFGTDVGHALAGALIRVLRLLP
jgi:hypothetical protein